jgi:hypothetical protein
MKEFPQIIAFTGKKFAGKSTAANALIAAYSGLHWRKISFADPLRSMLLALGITAAEMADPILKETPHPLLCGKTPRFALQSLGTQWGRGQIGADLWLKAAERRLHLAIEAGQTVAIDDARFDNEAQLIHRNGGIVIELRRTDNVVAFDPHPSEAGIFDHLIDATIESSEIPEMRRQLLGLLNGFFSTPRNAA